VCSFTPLLLVLLLLLVAGFAAVFLALLPACLYPRDGQAEGHG
jgi:hypothetical protein